MDHNSGKSVCIIYGVCEGPAEAVNFRKVLMDNRFKLENNPSLADIIFAHSGGCLLIPRDSRAKLIVFDGYPYWPGKSIVTSLFQNAFWDFRFHKKDKATLKWLYKTFWNFSYFWRMDRNFKMLQNISKPVIHNDKVFYALIRNRYDGGCLPEPADLPKDLAHTYITLQSGSHDDCWYRPSLYIDILKSLGN